jgi:uncharacterized tellurite resistance protein B-like protein
MQGAKNIILGLVFLAAGSGLIMFFNLGDGALKWSVWGLAGFGAILLVGGVYQMVGPGSGGVDAHQAYKSSSTARLLMQSMMATAVADGHIDDEEVETIVEACEEVVHEHMDPETIRELAELVEEKGDKILDEIRYEGKMLNLTARKAIIDACILVLKADGKIDSRQTRVVELIAEQLGFSPDEAAAMISGGVGEATA